MTLSIGVYVWDKANPSEMNWVELPPGNDLGGFEVYRKGFWGHDIMFWLGLILLPTLKDGVWLTIEDDDLNTLEYEGSVIQNNSQLISQKTQITEEFVLFYAKNILYATRLAKELGGGVSIG